MKIWYLWPFYLGRFVKSLIRIIKPFETLFYLWLWLTYTQIATIIIVQNVVTLIFEIPTSKFAEKYGNKWSVIVWHIFSWIFTVAIPFVSSFWLILLISWIVSFFKTFFSWSDRARIWELITKKDPKFLTKYFWLSKSINNFGIIFVWLLWTYIVNKTWTMDYLWIITWLWYILAWVILLFWEKWDINDSILWDTTEWFAKLRDYYKDWLSLLLSSKNEQIYLIKKKWNDIKSVFSYLKVWMKELFKNKNIIYLFVWMCLLFFLRRIWEMFRWPYFEEIWFDISKLWRLYSVSAVIWVVVPMIIPKLKDHKNRERYLLIIFTILWMIVLWSLFAWNILLLIWAYLVCKMVEDFIAPLDSSLSVDIISKKSRSVILSVREAVKSCFLIVWWLFSWIIFDKFSILWWWVIISILIVILWLTYTTISKNHRKWAA